jgi:hypothetical protein
MPAPALALPPVPPPFPRPAFPRPLFWTVQGADFGRSIAWARRQPRLRDLLPTPYVPGECQESAPAGSVLI